MYCTYFILFYLVHKKSYLSIVDTVRFCTCMAVKSPHTKCACHHINLDWYFLYQSTGKLKIKKMAVIPAVEILRTSSTLNLGSLKYSFTLLTYFSDRLSLSKVVKLRRNCVSVIMTLAPAQLTSFNCFRMTTHSHTF